MLLRIIIKKVITLAVVASNALAITIEEIKEKLCYEDYLNSLVREDTIDDFIIGSKLNIKTFISKIPYSEEETSKLFGLISEKTYTIEHFYKPKFMERSGNITKGDDGQKWEALVTAKEPILYDLYEKYVVFPGATIYISGYSKEEAKKLKLYSYVNTDI